MAKDKDYREIIGSIAAYTGELRRATPAVMQGFGALAKAATTPGAVDAKTKELIVGGGGAQRQNEVSTHHTTRRTAAYRKASTEVLSFAHSTTKWRPYRCVLLQFCRAVRASSCVMNSTKANPRMGFFVPVGGHLVNSGLK